MTSFMRRMGMCLAVIFWMASLEPLYIIAALALGRAERKHYERIAGNQA